MSPQVATASWMTPPVVVKVGGSLLDWPELNTRLNRFLASHSDRNLILVAGGGPVADVIRVLDRTHELGEEKSHWQVVPLTDTSAWAVLPLPAGTMTRALRLSFIRGGVGAADDLLADVEDKKGAPSLDKLDAPGTKKSKFESADEDLWQRRIEGKKSLRSIRSSTSRPTCGAV